MYGFVHVAAITPTVTVANPEKNADDIIKQAKEAYKRGIDVVVFPELCITGYTCNDLFFNNQLLDEARKKLCTIGAALKEMDMIIVVGLPFAVFGKLYNVAAVLYKGEILGMVPKSCLPGGRDGDETRYFAQGNECPQEVLVGGQKVPFGTNLLFCSRQNENFVLGVELGHDVWSMIPPSCRHAAAGATVIANLSADSEMVGKDCFRRKLVSSQSARLLGGYIYASAGYGESTTDVVFAGHNMICENGTIRSESKRFQNGILYGTLDTSFLAGERQKQTMFHIHAEHHQRVYFNMEERQTKPIGLISKTPFVPCDEASKEKRCNEIMTMQALGLRKRMEHIGCKNVVLGISGGLDSTHALLVTAETFKMMGLSPKGIHTVTMPCFGTSDRTYQNAIKLAEQLGTTFYEINIKESVLKHFADIGQDPNQKDVTFENAQARERTQILMDMSNQLNGFVVGTGDLSELALGFATYNGDHMSMYGVNASVPKTLMRYLVRYVADCANDGLQEILYDILDTPVSPELLPGTNGAIEQVTEDIVGPYELHDFFLYYFVRKNFQVDKILYLATIAFDGVYEAAVIAKWLNIFMKRFFSQQYKRSCMPDGPKVGSVSLSPRGDLKMASDCAVDLFIPHATHS